MSLSRFAGLLRQGSARAVASPARAAVQQAIRLSSSQAGEPFIKRHALNLIGLPVCCFVLFVIMPSYGPSEIHSIDYYDRKYLEEQKAREASKTA